MKTQQLISLVMQRVSENVRRARNMIEDARDFFSRLQAEVDAEDRYIDAIWALRYPQPSPKASSAWPYRSAADTVEAPSKVRALRR